MMDAMHILAPWVYYWVIWLVFINLFSVIFIFKHVEARWVLGVFVVVAFSMHLLFLQVGMVRLLGIVHVIYWTPLLIYMFRRFKKIATKTSYGIYIRILMLTIATSLAIDYVDVVRYFLGHGS